MSGLPVHHLPGTPGEAGLAHGRALREMFEPGFREAYVRHFLRTNRVERGDLTRQAERWLGNLPAHFQEEIEGMARGAGIGVLGMAEFLYADIARPTGGADARLASPGEEPARMEREGRAGREAEPAGGTPAPGGAEEAEPADGPMCSGVLLAATGGAETWVGRNCDWLVPTLLRGTAAMVHAAPGRIPVMAVGIRGDIDVDTGINAERLWLHLHTLLAMDDPPRDRTCISWLFWAREALETCASLDELERFIAGTARDRGVIVLAADGKTGEAAIFECTKGDHRRVDGGRGRTLLATNHPHDKPIDAERERRSRRGSTVARFCALRRIVHEHPPEALPDDLIETLADPGVEMRDPPSLRTIYSAVARPRTGEVWFASGSADGTPAASGGRWERVPWRF